jgi:hypothetical protein
MDSALVSRKSRPDRSSNLWAARPRLLSFVHTRIFLAKWTALGLDDDDLRDLENQILERPEEGAVVPGTGGLRKLRFTSSRSSKGKSGSERVCYALYPTPGLVVLILAYGKNEKEDLEPAEKKQIKAMLESYESQLRKGAGG